MNRLQRKFEELKTRGEKGLIGFIMAGEPDMATGVECARVLQDAGCDILEIGVPYSDPIADGEVIERAHFRGIERGMNLSRGLEFMAAVRDKCELPLVMFSYFNPIHRRGMAAFASELREAGGDAVIIPDLTLEEHFRYRVQDLDVIPMVAPTTGAKRIRLADSVARSFLYCVSVAGVTGIRQNLPDLREYLLRVRANTSRPVAVGFGISSAEQVAGLKEYADALVVGSLLVGTIERYARERKGLLVELANAVAVLKAATK
ncbi:MAG: tryptophan synthase subunit alpha [Syntrophomonadaceae bacterium]|nr:tryptophan synthase subunit alpha [Syntrophomonadaceae bacterium]